MQKLIARVLADRQGTVAVTAALLFTVMLGIAALGVDIGTLFTDRRKAQSTADLAAIAAASDLSNADKAAGATISRNRLSHEASYSLQLGVYTPDPAVAAANRFVPASSATANAARVTLRTTSSLFLAKPLTGKSALAMSATATATRSAFASFAIGSRLLKVDGGLLDTILGGLLGSSLSLSVMDYQSLVDTQIDLFGFSNALATRLQLTAATYNSVMNSNAKLTDVVGAMVDTQRSQYGSADTSVKALSSVLQSVQGSTTKLKVGSIVDLGPYSGMPVSEKPKVGISASSYDANGQHQVEVNLNLNVPGIAAASLKIAIGERPQGTSWVTVGAQGASVYTAQTRLLLTVQLAGAPPASIVTVPIYVAIASGSAKLTSVQCGFPNVSASSVTLGVTPGIVDAWIGNVSSSQFTNFTSAPNPPAATLVSLPLLQVTGRAHASVSNMSATPVTFSYYDIQQRTKKTVGTTDFTASLLSRLISDTQLGVSTLGLGLGLGAPAVSTLVAGVLSSAASPIDQLLSTVLQALGVGLGQADVWVLGVRCDGAVLVN